MCDYNTLIIKKRQKPRVTHKEEKKILYMNDRLRGVKTIFFFCPCFSFCPLLGSQLIWPTIWTINSCDGWWCDLGVVDTSSIFGWVRGAGAFVPVLPTFVLVSRMQLAQQYRGNDHFLITSSSSWRETMTPIAFVWWVGLWFGCGGSVFDIWVGTWGRGFRSSASALVRFSVLMLREWCVVQQHVHP